MPRKKKEVQVEEVITVDKEGAVVDKLVEEVTVDESSGNNSSTEYSQLVIDEFGNIAYSASSAFSGEYLATSQALANSALNAANSHIQQTDLDMAVSVRSIDKILNLTAKQIER